MWNRKLALALTVLAWLPMSPLAAAANGRIAGIVQARDGSGLGGVSVTLGTAVQVTDANGRFAFEGVAAGDWSLTLALGTKTAKQTGVRVREGETTDIIVTPGWETTFAETLTVYSASRRQERIVEAPAAVTTLSERDVHLTGASGAVPDLLAFTVGAQATQNGLYDFNFNTRGFNNTLNRRIQTLVDGRDPSIPFVSSQEWATMSSLVDDLARVELLRGPSAALYGPNTFNGVLNLVTRDPRSSPGGLVRLTGGELATTKADLRWARELGEGWYGKAVGELSRSGNFTRSRDRSVEYPGLELEAVPLARSDIDIKSGSLRLDKYLAGGSRCTIEGGGSDIANVTFLTGAGRSEAVASNRSWVRAEYDAPQLNFLGYHNQRTGEQLVLSSGTQSFLDDRNTRLEIQANTGFREGRGRLVGGVSYFEQTSDSADPQGIETLFRAPIHSTARAAFGQLDYDLTSQLKLVLALRWDGSSLHDPQVSPKGSLVYALTPNHVLRLGYNEAFQVGTYAELFLRLPAGPPLDLSALEPLFGPLPSGVSLGLDSVPLLALGNPDLKVEKIRSLEVGYSGILGERTFLTCDYYYNQMRDFITDLLPGVNPGLPPYRAPSQLPPALAARIEQVLNSHVPGLTNSPSGDPILALSFGNTGQVDSQGIEAALSYDLLETWLFDLNYAWSDFRIRQLTPGTEVHPNAPRNSASLGVTYQRDRLAATLRHHWVEAFDWASGIYRGRVPSYQVTGLAASYALSARWQVGLDVSNLLDKRHYEVFGGDILRRRALLYLAYSW